MKIYSVRFNTYDSGVLQSLNDPKTVSKIVDGKKRSIKMSKFGELLIPEFDLQKYESYGNGYECVKIVGVLDDSYFLGISEKEADAALDMIVSEPLKKEKVETTSAPISPPPMPKSANPENSKPKKKFEIRSMSSAAMGGKPLAIIDAKNEKEAWEIARNQFPILKNGHLSVRPLLNSTA